MSPINYLHRFLVHLLILYILFISDSCQAMYIRPPIILRQHMITPLSNNATCFSSVVATASPSSVSDQLDYYQTMTAGAISRTFAQTIMHPVNTFKTILQIRGSSLKNLTPARLLRGADAQFLMSLPHG